MISVDYTAGTLHLCPHTVLKIELSQFFALSQGAIPACGELPTSDEAKSLPQCPEYPTQQHRPSLGALRLLIPLLQCLVDWCIPNESLGSSLCCVYQDSQVACSYKHICLLLSILTPYWKEMVRLSEPVLPAFRLVGRLPELIPTHLALSILKSWAGCSECPLYLSVKE